MGQLVVHDEPQLSEVLLVLLLQEVFLDITVEQSGMLILSELLL